MLKYFTKKNKIYKLFQIKKKYIYVNYKQTYSVYYLLIKKKYILHTGETFYLSKIHNPLNLKKNFKQFIITKKPKSYPFRVIKNKC